MNYTEGIEFERVCIKFDKSMPIVFLQHCNQEIRLISPGEITFVSEGKHK